MRERRGGGGSVVEEKKSEVKDGRRINDGV